jgi:hypothetical protein
MKFKLEIILAIYWLANAGNAVRLSQEPGYYPQRLIDQARALAKLEPYPWREIFIVWGLLGMATIGLYLLIVKSRHKTLSAIICSFSIMLLYVLSVPTDVGGVQYAISDYAICTLLLALVYALVTFILNRRHRAAAP